MYTFFRVSSDKIMQSNKMTYLLCMSVILFTMSRVSTDCPDHCVCNATDLECFKTLPSFIPENVSSVTAHEVPLKSNMNFTYTDWHSVTHLSLSLGNVNKTKFTLGRLQDYAFTGLVNLQHLKLLCYCRLSVNSCAFYGLTNVTVLDLSNNVVNSLDMSDIVAALKGEDILPNISELYLSNITYWYGSTSSLSLYLDNLHTAMENKPLQVLDLSGTSLAFYLYPSHTPPPPSLLPKLHTLNISRAGPAVFSLTRIYKYYIERPEAVFSNLQVLDASYPYFPRSQSQCKTSPYYYWQFCKTGQHTTNFLPSNLTDLYIPNIFASQIHELRGEFNTTHLCITTMIFSTNKTICVGVNLRRIQKLALSDNSFTYIQPELLYSLTSLRHLDISNNKLGQAMNDSKYARLFFHALKSTKTLLCSNNSITFLPSEILQHNTKLKLLNLSKNELTSVNLGLNGQAPLELLDLSYNRIVSVDSAGCELLKNLRFSSNSSMSHNDSQTGLRLEGNPLSCTSCENICLFKFLQDQNITLTCTSNEEVQNADFLFVKHLEYSCKKGIVIAVFSTNGVFTVIILAVMVYVILKDQKEIKREKARKMRAALIERAIEKGIERQAEGENDHVAFLSYSSDDQSFVLDNVFPKLDEGLKGILKIQKRCVGVGALDMVPGHHIHREIIKCLEKTSVVIFLVTKSFCKQHWCEVEFETAIQIKKPIILMMYGKVKRRRMPPVLRAHFESYIRVHWIMQNGVPVMMPGWDFLCPSIFKLIGEQQKPAPEVESDSDDENVCAGGDSDTTATAAITSGSRDDLTKCDNDSKAGGNSDAAVVNNSIDTVEKCTASGDCTTPVTNPCTDTAERCSAGGDSIAIECSTDMVECGKCNTPVANPCTDTAERCCASGDCTAIDRSTDMVEHDDATVSVKIQVVADVHVNGSVDSVRDSEDDKAVVKCDRHKKVCENVQVVGNVDSAANTSMPRFGVEKHDDSIHHIASIEVENVNSGSSVDENIVVVGSEDVDNVDQEDESKDLGDERNPLLQRLKPNCGIM